MKVSKETYELLKEKGTILQNGKEQNDPRAMVIDANLERPPTLQEQIRRIIKTDLAIQAQNQGYETFEEANDFNIDGEDDEPPTKYEVMTDELPLNGNSSLVDEEPENAADDEAVAGEPADPAAVDANTPQT